MRLTKKKLLIPVKIVNVLKPFFSFQDKLVYDNEYALIIDIYFYEYFL